MRWTKDDVYFLNYSLDICESYIHPRDWARLKKMRASLLRMIQKRTKRRTYPLKPR